MGVPFSSRGVWHSSHIATLSTMYLPRSTSVWLPASLDCPCAGSHPTASPRKDSKKLLVSLVIANIHDKISPMRWLCLLAATAVSLFAQLAPPNDAGVSMG